MNQMGDFPFGIEDVVRILRLNVRRPRADGAYVDCPFCGEGHGRMKVNYEQNVWRCNYCGESGGMLALYARLHHTTNREAYREICNDIQNGQIDADWRQIQPKNRENPSPASVRAEIPVIHKTLTGLLGMLTLSEQHRTHLRTVRGLSDNQIEAFGFKTTPPFYLCRLLTQRLIANGYTVEGVPGFYQREKEWTVNFSTVTAGILIPIRGIDGMLRGFQIRLDKPLKHDGDKDSSGAKYISFSSANKPMGTSPGSPVHFVGDPFARVVYVTEGPLKADVAHALTGRTFAAILGANNTSPLDPLFSLLAENGTRTIIEAADMDKFRNIHVNHGTSTIYLLARKYGLDFQRLTWNPNYKGIDDWQLALRRKSKRKEEQKMNFKHQFLYGRCPFDSIKDEISRWESSEDSSVTLPDFLGFTDREYELYLQKRHEELKKVLLTSQRKIGLRIYQLRFDRESPTREYAFCGIQALYAAGYTQPPAADYKLVYDGVFICAAEDAESVVLRRIFETYNDDLPKDYSGRSISPSDVIELYDENGRWYFYCDIHGFVSVKFSPMFAKKENGR